MQWTTQHSVQVTTCILVILAASVVTVNTCTPSECGINQVCINDTCACKDSFVLHSNDKDCIDVSCGIEDCVLCNGDKCKRCVHYINKDTSACSDTCSGTADVSYDGDVIGNICLDSSEKMDIVIGVVAGISATLLLIFISGVLLCLKVKQRRRDMLHKTQSSLPRVHPTMDYGHVKRLPIFDNIGFEADVTEEDKENFRSEVDLLKIHTDRLHLILYETRLKLRTMDPSDPRVPTYKGVIHQLCRVLVLLNKKDPCISVPADGLSLIGWANQMLEDFTECQDKHNVSFGSIRYSEFPSVSLDAQGLVNAVYAVPNGHPNNSRPQQYRLHPVSSKIPGYYSSVPVPFVDSSANCDQVPQAHSSADGALSSTHVCHRHTTNDDVAEPFSRHSSNSDYSQQEFTTFSGGLPWLQSGSMSRSSDYSESVVNPDGLPFSLDEATEPIEV